MTIVKKNRDIDLMMAVISKKTVTVPNNYGISTKWKLFYILR